MDNSKQERNCWNCGDSGKCIHEGHCGKFYNYVHWQPLAQEVKEHGEQAINLNGKESKRFTVICYQLEESELWPSEFGVQDALKKQWGICGYDFKVIPQVEPTPNGQAGDVDKQILEIIGSIGYTEYAGNRTDEEWKVKLDALFAQKYAHIRGEVIDRFKDMLFESFQIPISGIHGTYERGDIRHFINKIADELKREGV